MRKKGLRLWFDTTPGFWAFGFRLWRWPAMFSSGKGPEYGAEVDFAAMRFQMTYSKPWAKADLARMRSAFQAVRKP